MTPPHFPEKLGFRLLIAGEMAPKEKSTWGFQSNPPQAGPFLRKNRKNHARIRGRNASTAGATPTSTTDIAQLARVAQRSRNSLVSIARQVKVKARLSGEIYSRFSDYSPLNSMANRLDETPFQSHFR